MNDGMMNIQEFINNYKKQREILLNKHYNLGSIRSTGNYNSFPRQLIANNKEYHD